MIIISYAFSAKALHYLLPRSQNTILSFKNKCDRFRDCGWLHDLVRNMWNEILSLERVSIRYTHRIACCPKIYIFDGSSLDRVICSGVIPVKDLSWVIQKRFFFSLDHTGNRIFKHTFWCHLKTVLSMYFNFLKSAKFYFKKVRSVCRLFLFFFKILAHWTVCFAFLGSQHGVLFEAQKLQTEVSFWNSIPLNWAVTSRYVRVPRRVRSEYSQFNW